VNVKKNFYLHVHFFNIFFSRALNVGLKLYNKLSHHINQIFKRELQCFLLQYACRVNLADISCTVKNELSDIILCIFNVYVFV